MTTHLAAELASPHTVRLERRFAPPLGPHRVRQLLARAKSWRAAGQLILGTDAIAIDRLYVT